MRFRPPILLVGLFMLSLILAACGGGSGQESAANTNTAAANTNTAAANTNTAAANTNTAANPTVAPSEAAIPEAETTPLAQQNPQPGGGFKLNTNVSGNIEFWHFWSSPLRRTAIRRVISLCEAKLPTSKSMKRPNRLATSGLPTLQRLQPGRACRM